METHLLTITEKKFIYCLYELGKRGYAPSESGLHSILRGDASFASFANLETYGCLLSLKSRRCKAIVRKLNEKGAVRLNYSREEDEIYLFPSQGAIDVTKAYFSTHQIVKKERLNGKKSPLIKIC